MKLSEKIEEELKRAVRVLPPDVKACIEDAAANEDGKLGKVVLKRILENIEAAENSDVPLCQDTGMFYCIAEIGRDARASLQLLEKEITEGARNAAKNAFFRKSIVADPVYDRENTKDNLPLVINYELVDGCDIALHFLLKGFGSENCSSVRMLRPTAGEDGVVDAVVEMMKAAGGKPCPPVFLGVGVGGTMDRAAFLSKKALTRDASKRNADKRYASMERRMLEEVNKLGIGPGGLGGRNTGLSVAIEAEPTHIASLPVALSVNCWADRKAKIVITGGYDERA